MPSFSFSSSSAMSSSVSFDHPIHNFEPNVIEGWGGDPEVLLGLFFPTFSCPSVRLHAVFDRGMLERGKMESGPLVNERKRQGRQDT